MDNLWIISILCLILSVTALIINIFKKGPQGETGPRGSPGPVGDLTSSQINYVDRKVDEKAREIINTEISNLKEELYVDDEETVKKCQQSETTKSLATDCGVFGIDCDGAEPLLTLVKGSEDCSLSLPCD